MGMRKYFLMKKILSILLFSIPLLACCQPMRMLIGRPNPPNLLIGIVAYYTFDGTGSTVDATGNGHAPYTTNGLSINVSGKIATCYSFNGSNSYIEITGINAPAFTYGAWVKTSSSTSQTIFSNDTTGGQYFRINADQTLSLISQGGSTVATSTGTITLSVFNYVAVTYDASGNYNFYINGSIAGSGTNLVSFKIGYNSVIGATDPAVNTMNGLIDEIGIWGRALTNTEIGLLYNSGSGKTYPF